MLSRKYYKIIAESLSLIKDEKEIDKVTDFLTPIFKADNYNFDKDKFKDFIFKKRCGL